MSNAASTFGQCWSCVSDLSSPGVYVSGNRAVAEAIARRLQTPRGGLIDDPTYGYDLTYFLNAELSTTDLALIQSNTNAECLKDERVTAAATSLTFTGGVLIVTIAVTTSTGPFTLVLSVSSVAANPVQILAVTP
jgi:phage baseplate assembly protein W